MHHDAGCSNHDKTYLTLLMKGKNNKSKGCYSLGKRNIGFFPGSRSCQNDGAHTEPIEQALKEKWIPLCDIAS